MRVKLNAFGRLTVIVQIFAMLLCGCNLYVHVVAGNVFWCIFWAVLGAYNTKNYITTVRMLRWLNRQ